MRAAEQSTMSRKFSTSFRGVSHEGAPQSCGGDDTNRCSRTADVPRWQRKTMTSFKSTPMMPKCSGVRVQFSVFNTARERPQAFLPFSRLCMATIGSHSRIRRLARTAQTAQTVTILGVIRSCLLALLIIEGMRPATQAMGKKGTSPSPNTVEYILLAAPAFLIFYAIYTLLLNPRYSVLLSSNWIGLLKNQ